MLYVLPAIHTRTPNRPLDPPKTNRKRDQKRPQAKTHPPPRTNCQVSYKPVTNQLWVGEVREKGVREESKQSARGKCSARQRWQQSSIYIYIYINIAVEPKQVRKRHTR